MPNTLDTFLWAIGQVESGGNYNAVNPNSGALGRWQVMPSNVCPWTIEAIGFCASATQFLDNPWIQIDVATKILGGYYYRYGPRGAAAMWYSGQPDPNATFGDPPVYQYVNNVMALMGNPDTGPGLPAQSAGNPDVSSWDWSPLILQAHHEIWWGGYNMGVQADGIRKLRRYIV